MRRGAWFAAGIVSGVYASVRARRAAEALSAEGIKDRAQAIAHGARVFRDQVAQGAHEREAELRPRFGLGPAAGEPGELTSARPQPLRLAPRARPQEQTGPTRRPDELTEKEH